MFSYVRINRFTRSCQRELVKGVYGRSHMQLRQGNERLPVSIYMIKSCGTRLIRIIICMPRYNHNDIETLNYVIELT